MKRVKKGRVAAVAALGATLALSMVAAPAVTAFADDNDTASATTLSTVYYIDFVYENEDGTTGTVSTFANEMGADGYVRLSDDMLDILKMSIPNWDSIESFTWTDSQGNSHQFATDQLAGYIWSEDCTVAVNFAETEEPPVVDDDDDVVVDESTDLYNIVFNYANEDGTTDTVSVFADVKGDDGYVRLSDDMINILKNFIPDWDNIESFTWTDSQGNGHLFTTDLLEDGYIWTEDCTVTVNYADDVEEPPAVDEDSTVYYINFDYESEDGTTGTVSVFADVEDEYGYVRLSDDMINILKNFIPDWDNIESFTWTDSQGNGHLFTTDLLEDGYIWTEDCTVTVNYADDVEEPPAVETHTVTFEDYLDWTDNLVLTVTDGEAVPRPDDPICDGWTFVGWFTDTTWSDEYDFSAPVTEDIVLHAKWVKNADTSTGTDGTDKTPTDPQQTATNEATETNESTDLPKTGDASLVVSGVVAAGAVLSGAGVALRKRMNR